MSTPEQNKATLARVYKEAFNENKLDVIDETYAPNYEFQAPPLKDGTVMSGREAFKQRVASFRNAFKDIKYVIQDIIADGDLVAHRAYFGGVQVGEFNGFPATNREAYITYIHYALFDENGQIKRTWAGFTNIDEVLGQ